MRKDNWIFYLAACAASVILLFIWYTFGMNQVDAPLDLILSIIWWVIIIASVLIVWKLESQREYQQRAVYVKKSGALFSPELGAVVYGDMDMLSSIAKVVSSLEYPLDMKKLDDENMGEVTHIVYTDKFEHDGTRVWTGKVVSFGDDGKAYEVGYGNKEELADLLA